jgi:hypothetical protein
LEPALVELEVWRMDRAREPASGRGNEALRAVQRASESKMMRMAKALLSKSVFFKENYEVLLRSDLL